eukprot:scaffold3210_cov27-Prasinocladus_malaysianus.AAC.1
MPRAARAAGGGHSQARRVRRPARVAPGAGRRAGLAHGRALLLPLQLLAQQRRGPQRHPQDTPHQPIITTTSKEK